MTPSKAVGGKKEQAVHPAHTLSIDTYLSWANLILQQALNPGFEMYPELTLHTRFDMIYGSVCTLDASRRERASSALCPYLQY